MADSTSTIVDTIITEAEIGEVRLKPLKSMLKATQKSGGNNTENHHLFSLGINNQANQNKGLNHTQKK
jgi:hypothetical protein